MQRNGDFLSSETEFEPQNLCQTVSDRELDGDMSVLERYGASLSSRGTVIVAAVVAVFVTNREIEAVGGIIRASKVSQG